MRPVYSLLAWLLFLIYAKGETPLRFSATDKSSKELWEVFTSDYVNTQHSLPRFCVVIEGLKSELSDEKRYSEEKIQQLYAVEPDKRIQRSILRKGYTKLDSLFWNNDKWIFKVNGAVVTAEKGKKPMVLGFNPMIACVAGPVAMITNGAKTLDDVKWFTDQPPDSVATDGRFEHGRWFRKSHAHAFGDDGKRIPDFEIMVEVMVDRMSNNIPVRTRYFAVWNQRRESRLDSEIRIEWSDSEKNISVPLSLEGIIYFGGAEHGSSFSNLKCKLHWQFGGACSDDLFKESDVGNREIEIPK